MFTIVCLRGGQTRQHRPQVLINIPRYAFSFAFVAQPAESL
jgi:hypothetical protein